MNADFYEGLSDEHKTLINWAAEVATDAGRSISRIIEASDRGLPALEAKSQFENRSWKLNLKLSKFY